MLGSRVRAPEGVRSENRKVLAFFVQSADVSRPATPPLFPCSISIQQKRSSFARTPTIFFIVQIPRPAGTGTSDGTKIILQIAFCNFYPNYFIANPVHFAIIAFALALLLRFSNVFISCSMSFCRLTEIVPTIYRMTSTTPLILWRLSPKTGTCLLPLMAFGKDKL